MFLPNTEFLTQFQKAPPELRHNFPTNSSSHFHPSNWHHLHSLLTTRSYYIDFLTALPIELSLHILQYLPPTQPILLRSVSRHYNNLLTSPETCRFLALHHFPWCTPPTHTTPPEDLWTIHYENTLSRRLRFEHAQPSRLENIPNSRNPIAFCAASSTFASTRGGDRIQVHLLTTSPPTLIFPPTTTLGEARITNSILTQSIIAVICKDTCQVWNLATHATHSFRIPTTPVRVSAFSGNGDIIVIAVRDDLVIHDAARDTTKIFETALRGLIPEWQDRHTFFLIAHEPTRRVWVGGTRSSGGDNAETTVTALSIDTAAIAVPIEKFYGLLGLWKPADDGTGVWIMGAYEPWENGRNLDIRQLRIDISRTTEAVCLRKYSVELLGDMDSALFCSPYMVNSWRGVNWTGMGTAWKESELKARPTSASGFEWREAESLVCFVGENFMVVYNRIVGSQDNLTVLRFDGVHDNVTSAGFSSPGS